MDWALVSARLIDWFGIHGRDLPWRQTRDPYAILVSELMLQQTTVASVLAGERFENFLQRFPDWKALADSAEEDVMQEWAGLGYYRRARNLRAAAQRVMAVHGGNMPPDLNALLALPGVGAYTAGAVASFAFGLATPLVDTNVARVLARVFGIESPLSESGTMVTLWEKAAHILPADGESARLHNSALMELGALVCRPRDPQCSACPIGANCQAHLRGLTESIPSRTTPTSKVERLMTAIAVVRADGCVLLRRAPESEWHGGMLTLPSLLQHPDDGAHLSGESLPWKSPGMGTLRDPLDTRFVVTRNKVRLRTWCYRLDDPTDGLGAEKSPGVEFNWPRAGADQVDRLVWIPLIRAEKAGLGSPYRKVVSLLQLPESPDLFAP